MKIVDGSWSVVIVGKWNRYILTPEWVGQKIFENESIEVQIPVNRPELAPRYKSPDNIILLPAIHRCQFLAQDPYNDEMLIKISSLINKLVSILEHTPIEAMGVNFGFIEASRNFCQIDMFAVSDSDRLLERKLTPISTEIKRQFTVNDSVLNLNIINKGEEIIFDFNFHYDVNSPQKVKELSTTTFILDNKNTALNIMREVYGLELEPNEGGGQ